MLPCALCPVPCALCPLPRRCTYQPCGKSPPSLTCALQVHSPAIWDAVPHQPLLFVDASQGPHMGLAFRDVAAMLRAQASTHPVVFYRLFRF